MTTLTKPEPEQPPSNVVPISFGYYLRRVPKEKDREPVRFPCDWTDGPEEAA